jgi:hypothetical protein
MDSHYICTSCKGESKFVGACQTEGCDKEGQPLTSCHCDNGSHHDLLGVGGDEASRTEIEI